MLVHYNPDLPLKVAADASSRGLGAVLSQVMPDGMEHPVAYASRTLSSAEKKYAQVEKEALALIFAVKKFHQYLYGRVFTLVTDHKPLLVFSDQRREFLLLQHLVSNDGRFCSRLTPTKLSTSHQKNMETRMLYQGYRYLNIPLK